MSELIMEIFRDKFDEAEKRGVIKDKERVAADMLRDGEPLEKITKYSRLAEDTIRDLARNLGIVLV